MSVRDHRPLGGYAPAAAGTEDLGQVTFRNQYILKLIFINVFVIKNEFRFINLDK